MKVYKAIENVMRDLGKEGIGKKKSQGTGVNYAFRGVDDVLNALNPLLAQHGLIIFPRVLSRETVERQSKSGGALFYTFLHAEFDFVSSEDGSQHTVSTFGEAMDTSDKSTNKAMSAAYKYAAFQTFCIPTEAVDSEADNHELEPKTNSKGPSLPQEQFSAPPSTGGAKNISEAQRKRLWAIMKGAGMTEETLKDIIAKYGYKSTKDIHFSNYEAICKTVESYIA